MEVASRRWLQQHDPDRWRFRGRNSRPGVGTPGPQEAVRPTNFWDLLPYLAHWASLPLFCFRPPSPCPRAAAMPYGAEARLQRCCWCLLVNVDTLAYTVPRATGASRETHAACTIPHACHALCPCPVGVWAPSLSGTWLGSAPFLVRFLVLQ